MQKYVWKWIQNDKIKRKKKKDLLFLKNEKNNQICNGFFLHSIEESWFDYYFLKFIDSNALISFGNDFFFFFLRYCGIWCLKKKKIMVKKEMKEWILIGKKFKKNENEKWIDLKFDHSTFFKF